MQSLATREKPATGATQRGQVYFAQGGSAIIYYKEQFLGGGGARGKSIPRVAKAS